MKIFYAMLGVTALSVSAVAFSRRAAPKKDVFVGTVYGQAGFNWMVHEIEQNVYWQKKPNAITNSVS